jgi:hypothetical protein
VQRAERLLSWISRVLISRVAYEVVNTGMQSYDCSSNYLLRICSCELEIEPDLNVFPSYCEVIVYRIQISILPYAEHLEPLASKYLLLDPDLRLLAQLHIPHI